MTDWLDVRIGDNRVILDELPERSVHCVVTSPPYWSLRDYGHAEQLGLEATPEEYVANMVDVFRKVRRVLRDDGTVWLNLGDSYAGSGKGAWGDDEAREANRHRVKEVYVPTRAESPLAGKTPPGLKPKDLVGIPWRVAFALQADGWYLRSDIIWSKPNPMPESVTDRPTKSHEYLFLLSRSPRYYFDQEAVREATDDYHVVAPDSWAVGEQSHDTVDFSRRERGRPTDILTSERRSGRNIRSVWTIPTKPYPGAHFAVFPPALVEPCIKAGTSERGVCPECGAPWERVVERGESDYERLGGRDRWREMDAEGVERGVILRTGEGGQTRTVNGTVPSLRAASVQTTGWRPTCSHDAPTAPATVLDLFAGSGTVGMVANKLSRRAILIDLNPDYLEQIEKRNAQTPLGLTS